MVSPMYLNESRLRSEGHLGLRLQIRRCKWYLDFGEVVPESHKDDYMERRTIKKISVAWGLLLALTGCQKGGQDQMIYLKAQLERLEAIPQEKWDALAGKKIYFGHKSVGQNIIEGLQDILARYPAIKLQIRETADPAAFVQPVFAHSRLGANKFPITKMDGFRKIMESGVGQTADIAFFKLCFVDIDHGTDLEGVFNSYAEAVGQVKARFPGLKLITFTVPLVSEPVGWKSQLRRLLGRMPWYEADHIQRCLYNNLLRKEFGDSLFDLAAFESRINDTERASITKSGRRYEILHRGYTDDGGHLNSVGRQIVAIELLCYLAAIEE